MMAAAAGFILLATGALLAFASGTGPNTTMFGILLMVTGGFAFLPSMSASRTAHPDQLSSPSRRDAQTTSR